MSLRAFILFTLGCLALFVGATCCHALELPPLPDGTSTTFAPTIRVKSLQSPKASSVQPNAVMLPRNKLLIARNQNQTTVSLNSDSGSVLVLQKSSDLKHWSPAVQTTGVDGAVTEIQEESTNAIAFYRTASQPRSNIFLGSVLGDVISTPKGTGYIWPNAFNYQQHFGFTQTNGVRTTVRLVDNLPRSHCAATFVPATSDVDMFYKGAFMRYGDYHWQTHFVTYHLSGVPTNMAVQSITTNWVWTAETEFDEYLQPLGLVLCKDGQLVGSSISTRTISDGAGYRSRNWFPYKKRNGQFAVLYYEKLEFDFGSVMATMCQTGDGLVHFYTQYDGQPSADEIVLRFNAQDVLEVAAVNYDVCEVYGENTVISCAPDGNNVWLACSAGETIQVCDSPFDPNCTRPWFKVTRTHLNKLIAGSDTVQWWAMPWWQKREERAKVTVRAGIPSVRTLAIYEPYGTNWIQREATLAGAFIVTDCPNEAWQLCDGDFAGQAYDGGFTKWPRLQ